MLTRLACVLALIALAAGAAGCAERVTGGKAAAPSAKGAAKGAVEYPVPFYDRPYQDIHASAKQAWFLVETGYFVIGQKWDDMQRLINSKNPKEQAQGAENKKALSQELEKNIFGVNAKVEQLFQDAITKEPKNPLNCATYALYLKPRKRYKGTSGDFDNTESQAITMIDKAISIWPDEGSFYLLKIHILTEPHLCGDWLRTGAMEELAINKRLPDVRKLFEQAEKYWPDDDYVNYYRALLVTKYTDPAKFGEIRDEVLREIRAGNKKPADRSFFFFPPPLAPRITRVLIPKLEATTTEAQYIDHWNHFGHISQDDVAQLVDQLIATMSWPADKEDVGEVMFMLYRLGQIGPVDRSFFAIQLRVLTPFAQKAQRGSDDALKLGDALRYLTSQYVTVATYFNSVNLLPDLTKLDVVGVAELEGTRSRYQAIFETCQGHEAAYLKYAGGALGLKFDLPADTEKW